MAFGSRAPWPPSWEQLPAELPPPPWRTQGNTQSGGGESRPPLGTPLCPFHVRELQPTPWDPQDSRPGRGIQAGHLLDTWQIPGPLPSAGTRIQHALVLQNIHCWILLPTVVRKWLSGASGDICSWARQ